jgi:hypothetical protein
LRGRDAAIYDLGMVRNSCEWNVGRVLEVAVPCGYESAADVDAMIGMIRERVAAMPPDLSHVTIADWRGCRVLTTSAAERVLEMLRVANPRTERSALLHLRESPTAVMQFLRLVREAEHPARRLFTDVGELVAWVSEVLTPPEVARVRTFLGLDEGALRGSMVGALTTPPGGRRRA